MVVNGFSRSFSALMLSALALASPSVAAEACDVTIHFGSYCCGTDLQSHERIVGYLQQSPDVREFTERPSPQAREGEFDLCITTKGPGEARRIFDRAVSIIPVESKSAWTEVTLPGGAHFRTRWPGTSR